MKNRNTITLFTTIMLVLAFGPLPRAQAVIPAPDGGYPGGNTAEGQNALLSLTTGGFNTAVGFFSLFANTTGSFNTAVGAGALDLNTADNNTAIGARALLSNSTGSGNAANGAFALFSNTAGDSNTAIGLEALFSNTIGRSNTAIGELALYLNTEGIRNAAIGDSALFSNTTGGSNIAVGFGALNRNLMGSNNVALGASAGGGVITASNVICIGASVQGLNVDNTCFIGNIFDTTTQSGTTMLVVVSNGNQLGTTSSSRRFKKEIKPMGHASDAILALKPVTFQYKNDTSGKPQFGLVAEDVARIDPDLVVRDDNGEIYSVRYEAVNAMLLNEFLKEHRKVETLEATVAQQHRDFEAAVAELKGQIQKVSAQLELNNPAPQTVLNSQ